MIHRRVREQGEGRPSYTVKSLPPDERPRERLLRAGAEALSDGELLAIILRTGLPGEMVTELANDLLLEYGGFWGLARASAEQLARRRGLKGAKVAQVKAAFEIGRRMSESAREEDTRAQIRSPEDAARLLQFDMAALDQEEMRVVLLDTKNRVIGRPRTVYQGTLNSTSVRVGEIFKHAIRENAAAIVLAHNHPSGDVEPSAEDVKVTREVVRAGALLDVELLDHIIVSRRGFESLKRRGLGFQ